MIPGMTPADVGLPPKFSHWRPGQLLSLDRSLSSSKRFTAHQLPTGEGKSAYAVGLGLLAAKRVCYLTSSKGLQEQLMDDFSSIGMVDMRGRNNYPCHHDGCSNCEEGSHFKCACDSYEPAREAMLAAPFVETNYKYFMLSYLYGRGMGEFDLLICDEAHDADGEVCSAMAVDITFGEAQKTAMRLPGESASMKDWWDFAKLLGQKCLHEIERLRQAAKSDKADSGRVHPQTAKDQRFWESISHKCVQILTGEGDPDWVVERTPGGYHLEPIHARLYAHKILFMDIPKIVLMSATMVQKTLDLLGVKSEESDFYEYPSSFPARRSPVYLWGPCKVDHRILPEFIDVWLSRIDNFIRLRQDRKGIIHTVSYDRAQLITSRSEFALHMIQPGSGKHTADAIEEFKRSSPPSILVSPAITTGYDFHGSFCEYNIICKVPFVPTTSKLMKARQAADPDYSAYLTAQTLVQAHGRSMRAADDQSETVILDQHMNWFIRKYRSLFPFWFHRLIQYPKGMPQPPAALPRTIYRPPEAAALSTFTARVASSKVLQFPTQRTK
jgi:ATP-dependent DNA helicase DinG